MSSESQPSYRNFQKVNTHLEANGSIGLEILPDGEITYNTKSVIETFKIQAPISSQKVPIKLQKHINGSGFNELNVYHFMNLLDRPGGYPLFRILVDDCCNIFNFLAEDIRYEFALALLSTLERHTTYDDIFTYRSRELIFQVFFSLLNQEKPYFNNKFTWRFFNLCLSPASERWFKDTGRDREEEIIRALFDADNKPNLQVFIVLQEHPSLAERLRRWFLGSYNLYIINIYEQALKDYTNKQCEEKNPSVKREAKRKKNALINHTAPVADILSAFIWLIIPFSILAAILVVYGACQGAWQMAGALHTSDSLTYFAKLTILAGGGLATYAYCRRSSSTLRLWACILAGYLALISDESWTGILPFFNHTDFGVQWNMANIFRVMTRWFIFGGFTVIYLQREISNKIEPYKIADNFSKAVQLKTTAFSLRAIGYSFILGILVSDFFAETMILRNNQEILKAITGTAVHGNLANCLVSVPFMYGRIYPEIILAQAPIAMFIGIFINLLWEDTPLTEPL